jgi:hypothetical protein
LKFLAPKAGKEAVYAEGQRDNKLIAHAGDWTRRLVPRIAVAPSDPLALLDSRHPVTEAGVANLVKRLTEYRRLDLADPLAIAVMDRFQDDAGRSWFRSIHIPHAKQGRPFARVEVWYDPETLVPRHVDNYDWPRTDQAGDLELAESYTYEGINYDASIGDTDFDPANPAYAFTRY